MPTTIQVHQKTLHLLKGVKERTQASSYDEAINILANKQFSTEEMAGYLGKFIGKMSRAEILKGLRDKHDRF